MERRTAYYTGRVQGVGFRYTVQQLTGGLRVTGFVRNLPDGRVEVVVEGDPTDIDALLADVRERFEGHVSDVATTPGTATGEFRGFEVRR
jgi:acylphosphatase